MSKKDLSDDTHQLHLSNQPSIDPTNLQEDLVSQTLDSGPSQANITNLAQSIPSSSSISAVNVQAEMLDELAKIGTIKKLGNPRGAPKGRRTSLIGLKQQKRDNTKTKLRNKKEQPIAFISRDAETKITMMMIWLLSDAYEATRDYIKLKIKATDIDYSALNDSFIDTPLEDLQLLMLRMDNDAYEEFLHKVQQKIDEDDFKCIICAEKSHESCQEVVMCDGCMKWQHLVCVGLKRTPSGSWYCHLCSSPK